MPSYVLCFRVAEKLGGDVTPMDVAEVLDPLADDRTAAFWVQAALLLMAAEHIVQKRQRFREEGAASKQRVKSQMRGIGT